MLYIKYFDFEGIFLNIFMNFHSLLSKWELWRMKIIFSL